uniref:ATP synthase F0 subunit 8 n=1 Tax=Venturia canescens TaxID=32260 RepID=C4NCH3_9HYME|nr:ATP synthase F0 subunit 8 [Venturia canescens]
MPQMAPYSWFFLNFMFIMIIFSFIISINFISPMKKIFNNFKKKFFSFKIKW